MTTPRLTCVEARARVVDCFYRAQKETFARAAAAMGTAPSDAELQQTIEGAVRLAFRAAKADYEHPTKEGLMSAVAALAAKAAAMGTPTDIIDRHRAELGEVFTAIAD